MQQKLTVRKMATIALAAVSLGMGSGCGFEEERPLTPSEFSKISPALKLGQIVRLCGILRFINLDKPEVLRINGGNVLCLQQEVLQLPGESWDQVVILRAMCNSDKLDPLYRQRVNQVNSAQQLQTVELRVLQILPDGRPLLGHPLYRLPE